MTIEGAIAQLQELIDSEGIPFWAKPSLRKIMETVEMEREQYIEERKTGKEEKMNGELCKGCKYFEDEKCDVGHTCVNGSEYTCINDGKDYAECDQFVCSKCGIELQDWHRVERDMDDGEVSYHEYTFRFCPNCGAEMKGCADMKINRMNCEYRHDNGNCLKVGGFCTSVDDKHCLKAKSEEGAEE